MFADREDATQRMLYGFSQVMTIEQFQEAKKRLEEMPDNDFWQIVMEAIRSVPDGYNDKDFFNLAKKIQKRNGINVHNSALNNIGINVMPEEENKAILRRINETYPTDVINLTRQEDEKLIDLWERGDRSSVIIPSDLFFANTVPLKDCKISVDEREVGGISVDYRVVIFNDYDEKINATKDGEAVTVGAVIVSVMGTGGNIIIPITAIRGVDSIPIAPVGFQNMSIKHRNEIQSKFTQASLGQMIVCTLETWYGIQIALLHPTVQNVFKNPKTIRFTEKSNSGGAKKRKVKYVKKHVINKDELDKAIYGNQKSYKRHALIWYVIGHWREYKNGKKVFVQPYWKGALRDTKKQAEARERIIAEPNMATC